MTKISSGLLMFRRKNKNNELEFFLVHHGGPFWKNKDKKAWSIPKGEVKKEEDNLSAAKREFFEETGIKPKTKKFIPLGYVKQKSGKIVHAWSFEFNGEWDGILRQNIIKIRWPPKIGKEIKIPEIDKAGFFSKKKAREKMIEAQFEFILRLEQELRKI